jgi:hypothetical protein
MADILMTLSVLCEIFAVIDFAGMFLGYDLTGVPWSPLVAGGLGWLFHQLARASIGTEQPNQTRRSEGGRQFQTATAPSTKINQVKCPYCAEWIMEEAKLCRFCGHDVPWNKQESASEVASIAEIPTKGDARVRDLLQRFQDRKAYHREMAINEVRFAKLNDPRIVEALNILARSDKVDSIRKLAKRALAVINE